jgi:hypothetical protein
MIPKDDLELGQLSLLEVDNRVVIPARTHLQKDFQPTLAMSSLAELNDNNSVP